MDVIFSDYGIETKKEDERYYLNYDEGELVPEFRTIEISYAKVEKAMLGPEDAYEVIIAFQNRGMTRWGTTICSSPDCIR